MTLGLIAEDGAIVFDRADAALRRSEDTEWSGVPERPLTGRFESVTTMARAGLQGRLDGFR
jgi:hypothetical protein